MRLRDYQWRTEDTAIYPKNRALEYLSLGLGSEGGEILGEVKRVLRDDNMQITEERKHNIASEIGDLLWYVAQLATHLDLDLEDDVLALNIEKLKSRTARGVLRGSGSDR